MKQILLLTLLFLLCIPLVSGPQEERMGIRLIAVQTEAEAANLRAQIQNGVSFEALAKAHSTDASAKVGGYLGFLHLADLKPEFQQALDGLMPGRTSAVTRVGGEFLLLQKLSLEEGNWILSNEAGLQAFSAGRYEEAAQRFQQAVQYAEKLTPVDYRLEDSLHGLAETYRLQKKYTEAEPFYRRYLAIHWGGSNVPELLDRFSSLLARSYFKDSQFAEELRKFEQALDRAPLREETYQAMSTIFFKASLLPEAEALTVRATRLFPASKDVQFHRAQLFRTSLNARKALEAFEQLSKMKSPEGIDPSLDRLQQSVVFQKIGSICAELVEFDKAASAYKKALELTPDSAESRLGLGDLYLQQGKPEEALAEYSKVIAVNSQNAPAQFRVADIYLRMGRFQEAATAAANVLTLDRGHQRAHYVLATALVRIGQREEAEKELALYRKLEAETRSDVDRKRDIAVLNRGAAAKLLEGHPEEAIEMFRKIIESYPDGPAQYLNLGFAQSRLGQHKAAVETFQKMLSSGMADNFLVYWNLAHEYQLLGDLEAARRHEIVYLQNIDVALQEALDSNLE